MPGWMASILLVTVRIAALIFLAPGVSASVVPWRWRILLITLLVVPVLCVIAPIAKEVEVLLMPSLLLHELVIGISLALVPAVMIWGLQVATQTLQSMTGLPGGQSSTGDGLVGGTALERFMTITVLTIFFASSGHRQLVHAVLDSFAWLPPGHFAPLTGAKALLVDIFAASFALGVQAVLPIGAALFMSIMAVAAINRIMPQLGYFAVGMSVQTTVLLGSLVIFMGGIGMMMETQFQCSDSVNAVWKQLSSRPEIPSQSVRQTSEAGDAQLVRQTSKSGDVGGFDGPIAPSYGNSFGAVAKRAAAAVRIKGRDR